MNNEKKNQKDKSKFKAKDKIGKYNYFTFTVWLNSFNDGLFKFLVLHPNFGFQKRGVILWWTESLMIYLEKQRV